MVTTDRTRFALGKLPARIDVRTLALARYLDRDVLPAPPPALDLAAPVPDWPMYGNDRIGDCTTAAAGHMIEAWTAAAAGRAVEVSEQSVLAAFDAVKVVDPETGEEGAVELDVLNLWRSRRNRRPPDRRLRPRRERRPRPRSNRRIPVRRPLHRPADAAQRSAGPGRLGPGRPTSTGRTRPDRGAGTPSTSSATTTRGSPPSRGGCCSG